MKFSVKTAMICLTTLFVVFMAGMFVGSRWGASIPLADVSSLRPTELSISEIDDTYSVVDGRININTASADTLDLLPGISYEMAGKIIAYRDSIGRFAHIDQLKNVHGFGENRLEKIEKYITVGG